MQQKAVPPRAHLRSKAHPHPKTPSKQEQNPRRLAARIVRQAEKGEAYSSALLDDELGSIARADDRALCTELVYGTLRWHGALKASVERACERKAKVDPAVWPHLLVAAYQLQHLSERIPAHAAVNEAVTAVKRIRPGLAGFANAVLRRLGSAPHVLLRADAVDAARLSEAFFVPLVLCERICNVLPKEQWLTAVAAMNERPTLYARQLHDRAGRQDQFEPHAFVPGAFKMPSQSEQPLDAALRELHAVIQDPGSQTVALLVGAAPGNTVVDLCAAPGTKSMVLKAAVGEAGQVIACDVSAERAKRIEQNAKRLGLPVAVVVGDASKHETLRALQGKADKVLVDAPCSGLGTLRRHPETRFVEPELQRHAQTQLKLVGAGAGLLKVGGALVYSVCTPMHEEGEAVIERFLKKHPGFTREPVKTTLPWLPGSALTPRGDLLLWPHLHDADAFYAARIVKRS